MSIYSLVPDAKALLNLEPEELAGVLMVYRTRILGHKLVLSNEK